MWWICLLSAHNCKTLFPSVIPELPTAVLTDASLSGGGVPMGNRLDVCQLGLGLLISLLSPYQLQGDVYHCFSCTPLGTFLVRSSSNHQDRQSSGRSHSKRRLNLLSGDHGLNSFSVLAYEYCNFSLLVKHIPGTTNTLPGSNDFESYMSPLSVALLRSKGSTAT